MHNSQGSLCIIVKAVWLYTSAVYEKWQTHTHTQYPRAAICLPLVCRIKRQDVERAGGRSSGRWLNAPSMGLFSLQPNKCVTPIITRLILSFCYCSSTSISFCERRPDDNPALTKGPCATTRFHDQKCKTSRFHLHTFSVISSIMKACL